MWRRGYQSLHRGREIDVGTGGRTQCSVIKNTQLSITSTIEDSLGIWTTTKEVD